MSGPLLIAVALVAAGLAYVSLLAQPRLVSALSEQMRGLPNWTRGPEWVVPVVAGGVALGGAALCLSVLSAFIRGVQTAPYVWLSPVLVGFSGVVLARMRIDLPLAFVSAPLFAGLAGALMLGGGALVQMRGLASKLSGGLLLALPLLTLLGGYAHAGGGVEPAWRALDSSAALFLFVLALTCSGVGLVAFVARPAGLAHDLARSRFGQEQREQLVQALERAHASEALKAEAERRAQLAEYSLQVQGAQLAARSISSVRGDDTAEFVAHARPRAGRLLVTVACMLAFVAAGVGAYFAAYRPLARRVAVQQALAAESAKEHAAEVDALRKRFEAERAGLRAALAAERGQGAQAVAPPKAATDVPPPEPKAATPPPVKRAQPFAKSAQPTRSVEPVAAPKATANVAAKRAPRSSQSHHPVLTLTAHEKVRAHHAKPPTITAAAAKASADDKSAQGALKESVNDDPIGGLEGM